MTLECKLLYIVICKNKITKKIFILWRQYLVSVQLLDLRGSKLQNVLISVEVLSSWLFQQRGLISSELMNKETWFHSNAMSSGLLRNIHPKDGRNCSRTRKKVSAWLSRYQTNTLLAQWYRAIIELLSHFHIISNGTRNHLT